ncbi:MAG: FAD-dependent oxidoreductase [bacterium]|nr:FAD-dependent oxidoreductase [bacterium]
MLIDTEVKLEKLVPQHKEAFDFTIIGAGPAGMSAGVCAARAGLKVLVIEKALPGGECSTACMINNYLGNPGGILGEKLGQKMEEQLFSYPVYYTCENVNDIYDIHEKEKTIITDLDHEYKTSSIIIATGLEPKKLEAGWEAKFLGRGISYYARCDVDYYRNEDVMVIGGGNCACYAADYLANFVNQVYLVHSSNQLRAVKTIKEKILNNPKITPMWDSKVTEVFGIDKVEKTKVVSAITQNHTWIDVKGIFVYIGRIPPSILNIELRIDEDGYIITDEFMRTNIPGVYAAGDIRSKQIRQIATAVSDGMVAAINVERDIFR